MELRYTGDALPSDWVLVVVVVGLRVVVVVDLVGSIALTYSPDNTDTHVYLFAK